MNATSSKRGFLSLSFGFFSKLQCGISLSRRRKSLFSSFSFYHFFVSHYYIIKVSTRVIITVFGLTELFWTKVRKIGWQLRFNHVFVEVHTYHEKAYFSMSCLAPTWFRFMKYATDQTYKTCLLKKMSK